MKRWRLVHSRCAARVSLAGALAGIIACGDSGPSRPSSPTVMSVSVAGAAPALGGRAQFSASATFSDGQVRTVTTDATWISSAPSVATVSGGLVIAVGLGDVTISATFQGVRGSAQIAVAASADLSPFMRDYIEALFLGTGPLTPTDGVRGCPQGSGRWLGFPSGTNVQLLISSTVPQGSANALTEAAGTVPGASAGALSVTMGSTPDANPQPVPNQVTATTHPNPLSVGCGFAQGCTSFSFVPGTPLILSARAILATNQFSAAYVHDAIGHGVLGLCHVDGNVIGGARLSLMSFGPGVFSSALPLQLSDFDLLATRTVFNSGLNRGATRDDFLRIGLVNPPTGLTPAAPRTLAGTSQIPAVPVR